MRRLILDGHFRAGSNLLKRGRRTSHQVLAVMAVTVLIGFSPGIVLISRAQSPGPSPTRGPQGLTLPLAIDMALKTNPLLRATTSGQEMAAAQVEEARASRWPSVQLSETFARSNNPVFVFGSLLEQGRFGPQNFDPRFLNNPDPLNNARASLTFRLPLFDQKQSDTRLSQARIGQQQADLEKQLAEQQVRFEVLRAFYGVLVAEARQEVADEAVKLAESDVKRIGDMFDTGMVVQSDLLAAQVQLAEFRQQQIQAAGDIVTAKAALNTALGIAIDTPQEVAGLLVEKRFAVESQDELIRAAITNRPEFARARFRLSSSKERVRGARAEYWPRLDLFGNVGVSAGNFSTASSDYTIGASLTFNLFDAGRAARIRQAVAAEAVASAEQEQLANQIRFEVVRAYQQYVSARERVTVATRVVEQAKEALRIVQDRYQAGLTTITEALRAETTFVRARMMLLAARYDHYTGYAAVLLATGRLTDVQPFVS
jgi:outer membrane protein TolC